MNRNFMENLFDGVDVEWKPLGEVADLKRGKTITAKTKTAGDIPVISGGQKPAYYNSEYNREGETITVAGSGAYAGYIMFWDKPIFVSDAFSVKPNVSVMNTKYVFHFLLNNQSWIHNLQKGSGVPHVYPKDLAVIQVPIPCPNNPEKSLEIQEEIVRILDTFTELTAELTAELEARKKQYTYYRDQLLTFEEGEVEWKTLGEIFDFKNGINKGKEFFGSGDNIINYTDVFKNNKLFENSIVGKVQTTSSDIERFSCRRGDVFFTRTSETKDEIGYASVLLTDISICVFSGFLIRARPKTNLLLPEYCAYCFRSHEVRKEIINSSNMTTRVTTTGTILSKIKIPIPSLEEQAQIVSILDKFEALTSSITEGLPREIELRQKQYEYYRNMLLSFPKEVV